MATSYAANVSDAGDEGKNTAMQAAMNAFHEPTTSAEGLKRNQELLEAWQLAQAYFTPRDIGSSLHPPRPAEDPAQIAAIAFLDERGWRQDMVDEALDLMELNFGAVRRDVARYMGRFQETTALSRAPQTTEIMLEFLEKLNMWYRRWAVPMKIFGDNKIVSTYTSQFLQLLHSSLPAVFLDYFHTFLASSLASLPAHLSDPPHTEELLSTVPPPMSIEDIKPPSPHLSRLGMLPRYSAVLTAVAYQEIERIVKEEVAKGWEVRRMPRVRQRVAVGLVNWIASCFEKSPSTTQFLRTVFSRFDYYLCKCLFDIRTDELFNIIVDYPESLAALEDLKASHLASLSACGKLTIKECLAKIDQRDTLVNKLKASNLKRLLHPGAETSDVLTQYISTIRCLRILDPPGVLLHKVALPIRQHLRMRQDTTKCIVAALVEGEDLTDENDGGGGLIKDNRDNEVEDFSDPKWEPEPMDAAPEFRSGKAGDIVSTLVSIFETRKVIIKELQALLAQRLLLVKDYDSVKEIRIIEMLKLRFGEPALQICDVMLKDMADSKRIDDRIQSDIKTTLHPLVISHRFWPPVPSTNLQLPPKLASAQQAYEDAFHHFKPDKHLLFYQHLGTVTLNLELADRTLQVEATALQAAVLEVMEGQAEWDVSDLAEKLQIEEDAVHSALQFWAEEGVVQEQEGGAWVVLEYADTEE